jgi:signal peptidase I
MPLLSKDTPQEEQKRVESAWDTLRTLVYAIGLALLFRSIFFEPFHIPSGSMRGTLLEGDYIFVSKYSYGYSRYSFPFGAMVDFFDGRIMEDQPERGDVVVFRLPTDPSIDYIKRVIGLPGDTINVKDGIVHINGKEVERESASDFAFKVGDVEKRYPSYRETLPNGKSFMTLDETKFGEVDYTEDYKVPEGHYFMMGDNRDNSIDSRYTQQVGYVPAENLIGRAEIVLFSIDKSTEFEFWEFWKYPSMFRSGRFVLGIE